MCMYTGTLECSDSVVMQLVGGPGLSSIYPPSSYRAFQWAATCDVAHPHHAHPTLHLPCELQAQGKII
jgi:hypothetical protein